MTTSLAPVRDEHRELLPHIDQLRTTADRVGAMPRARLVADVQSSLDFLERHLRPHAVVEDEVMYPEVARLMGSPVAVATMRHDHEAIVGLTEELRAVLNDILVSREITRVTQNELRRLLYGLHTLIGVHFAKEEEVYLPLMESRLDDRDASRLLGAMQEHHRLHEQADQHRDTARDVLAAFNAGGLIDHPGTPGVNRPSPRSPAIDADAPPPF